MPNTSSRHPVLVTGGAGYIGSHTVLALQEAGFQPVVLDDLSTGNRTAVPKGVTFYEGDIGDAAAVAKILSDHRIRAVVHFAGSIVVPESVIDPLKYYRNNSANSLTLIQTAFAHGVRHFVFSSTAAVYGEPATVPVTEETALRPINPYGSSKLMTETMLRDLAKAEPDFRPVCLRYFNVAGADPAGRSGQQGPESTHLIRVATEVATGVRPVLEIYGNDYDTRDGTCERDYIHVSDLADVHVAALRYLDGGGEPGVFNCGYGQGYTVLEVVRCLEKVLGRPLPVRMADRRAGDPARLVSDVTKLRGALDWTPSHADLEHIIRTALAWQSGLAGRERERGAA